MPAETISALGSAARIIGATVVSIWAYPAGARGPAPPAREVGLVPDLPGGDRQLGHARVVLPEAPAGAIAGHRGDDEVAEVGLVRRRAQGRPCGGWAAGGPARAVEHHRQHLHPGPRGAGHERVGVAPGELPLRRLDLGPVEQLAKHPYAGCPLVVQDRNPGGLAEAVDVRRGGAEEVLRQGRGGRRSGQDGRQQRGGEDQYGDAESHLVQSNPGPAAWPGVQKLILILKRSAAMPINSHAPLVSACHARRRRLRRRGPGRPRGRPLQPHHLPSLARVRRRVAERRLAQRGGLARPAHRAGHRLRVRRHEHRPERHQRATDVFVVLRGGPGRTTARPGRSATTDLVSQRPRRPAGERPLLPARDRRRLAPRPELRGVRLGCLEPRARRHQRQARRVRLQHRAAVRSPACPWTRTAVSRTARPSRSPSTATASAWPSSRTRPTWP